tara:strand:+ start:198 stop:413 length:216 start_codon:yes stop_codon:yes gene_type:complete
MKYQTDFVTREVKDWMVKWISSQEGFKINKQTDFFECLTPKKGTLVFNMSRCGNNRYKVKFVEGLFTHEVS